MPFKTQTTWPVHILCVRELTNESYTTKTIFYLCFCPGGVLYSGTCFWFQRNKPSLSKNTQTTNKSPMSKCVSQTVRYPSSNCKAFLFVLFNEHFKVILLLQTFNNSEDHQLPAATLHSGRSHTDTRTAPLSPPRYTALAFPTFLTRAFLTQPQPGPPPAPPPPRGGTALRDRHSTWERPAHPVTALPTPYHPSTPGQPREPLTKTPPGRPRPPDTPGERDG